MLELRNKSWKPECALSFNMDWRILVFYLEPEERDKIYSILILLSNIDSLQQAEYYCRLCTVPYQEVNDSQ